MTFWKSIATLGCVGTIAVRVPEVDGTKDGSEVPDTLEALQNIARYLRKGFDGTVVGIPAVQERPPFEGDDS